MYSIHHRRILWSSYRKLAWVGFQPTTTEFHSNALTPWVQLTLKANFVQPLQFHCLFSVTFHFSYCLCQSPHLFELKVSWDNYMNVAEYIYIYRYSIQKHQFFHKIIQYVYMVITGSFNLSILHTIYVYIDSTEQGSNYLFDVLSWKFIISQLLVGWLKMKTFSTANFSSL